MKRRILCLLIGHNWHPGAGFLYFHTGNGERLHICYRCGVVRFK